MQTASPLKRRLRSFAAAGLAAAALLCGAAAPAGAQSIEELLRERERALRETPAPSEGEAAGGDRAAAPAPKLSPEEALEQAYRDLASEEAPIWRAAERKIVKAWSHSGSDSMDFLLKRGRDAISEKKFDAAIEHLTNLVNLAPDFAEGWSARATAHFHNGEAGAALADLAEAVAREPRHYTAYIGLGVIFEQLGEKQRAAQAYRKALAIHPNLETARKAIDRLSPDAEGRPI